MPHLKIRRLYLLTLPDYAFSTYTTSNLNDLKNKTHKTNKTKKNKKLHFKNKHPIFPYVNESAMRKKVAGEYCWAITQATGRSCCSRSGSSVECGFQGNPLLYSFPYVLLTCDLLKIRLAPDPPDGNLTIAEVGECL